MKRPYYNALPSKFKKNKRPLNGGLNNGFDVFSIGENQISDGLNLGHIHFPGLGTRGNKENVFAITGEEIPYFNSREDDKVLVVDPGTNNWQFWDEVGLAWSTILTLSNSDPAESIDFQGKTIIVNGTDRKYWDGTLSGDVTDMPLTDFVAVNTNRIFAASRDDDILHFSAIATFDDWTTPNDAGSIQIETDNGQNCTGLVSFSDHIVYFKKSSIHELYGISPVDFQMQVLTEDIGCIDNKSIVEVRGVLYFMALDGIYYYTGGTVPRKLSYPSIDAYIKNMDTSRDIVAGTDGTLLYMYISQLGGSQVMVTFNPDTGLFLTDDIEEVYQMLFYQENLYIASLYEFTAGVPVTSTKYNLVDGATESWPNLGIPTPNEAPPIPWNFVTKAFDENILTKSINVYQITLVYKLLEEDAEITIAISDTAEGTTFTNLETITESPYVGDITRRDIMVPNQYKDVFNWHRIRISGEKQVKIYNMEIKTRVKQDTF